MKLAQVLLALGALTFGGCADVTRSSAPSPGRTGTTRASAAAQAPTATPTSGSQPSHRPSAVASAPAPRVWPRRELTWAFETSAIGRTHVVVVIPETNKPLPVLIALHGLSEAQKGAAKGARGWVDDYGLQTALVRLKAPPLTHADMQRLGTSEHLKQTNHQLEVHPYEDLIVVCPYTPDIIGTARSLDAAVDLGRFLVEELLPKVYAETPAIGTPATTGIDGVSLGGRAALLVGLAHPDAFGVVGSLQAATYPKDLVELTDRAARARERNPQLVLRVVTSSHDFYRPTLADWSRKLNARGVEHEFEITDRGPHSYAFNRGLGVYSMLMFHARALRGHRGR